MIDKKTRGAVAVIGKKNLLSNILYHSKMLDFINMTTCNRLIVCNYHRLYDGQLQTDFDDGVFAHSVKHFEKHLLWLSRNSKILTENEFLEILTGDKKIAKLCSVITFDDGYIDNYLLAYPILKRLGIPAMFFIPSSPIISRQLGWWDIIAYFIKKSKKNSIFYDQELVSLEKKDVAIRLFQKIMKSKPHVETSGLLLKLSEACDVCLPEINTQSKELMTWNQIQEVAQNGIDIGSHTHSHRVLCTITTDEQREEMNTSKLIIEKNIGRKIRTIAYPVGNYQHFTSQTMSLASECGYEAAFSFNTGVNYSNNLNPFNVKRIEPPVNIELLAATAVLPDLFA